MVNTRRKEQQILLTLKYQELLAAGTSLPHFHDVEFRCFSQNGEDGILHFIFSLIGATNKTAVEICAGSGTECNTANLIINHGWKGLLFDGDEAQVNSGREFYARCQDTFVCPPRLIHAWITAENVNQLLENSGFVGEVDLLSLDMDGVDFWVWKSISVIQPRVVILEFQGAWGPNESKAVPYAADFVASAECPHYISASLAAYVKLGKEKGYRLVGCHRLGFNAVFIRDDVGQNIFPEISTEKCLSNLNTQSGQASSILEVLKLKPWIEI